ncbi:MAG: MBL fold metallo-hydrolase [Acidobacteriaceae bacterium]
MKALLTILGSGTSMGVPTLGCNCRVCTSTDPRDTRTRPSAMVEYADRRILIDTGPDFRAQALREGIDRVDAILYTHAHADHILGLDDLRPLSFLGEHRMPLYADDATATVLERIFDYTFSAESVYPNRARVDLHRIPDATSTMEIHGATFQRIPLKHGRLDVAGYRFGNAAYLTDVSEIPVESAPLLQGLDVLILDALRHTPHPSHSHLENSIALVNQLQPRRAWFTHMGHELHHADTDAALPPHIRLAYDGLRIPFEI